MKVRNMPGRKLRRRVRAEERMYGRAPVASHWTVVDMTARVGGKQRDSDGVAWHPTNKQGLPFRAARSK